LTGSQLINYFVQIQQALLTRNFSSGHESIVNTIAFHPHFLHVATAGVEKRILLHSPTPSSPCTQNLPLSPTHIRQLADDDREENSAAYIFALENSLSTDEVEEQITLSLFDQ
jgi:WD repeat-containing protein 22